MHMDGYLHNALGDRDNKVPRDHIKRKGSLLFTFMWEVYVVPSIL